ncbi:hypothetical protein SAMN02910447_00897 [Ruminococcus sp. YE71]|uniref:hypothetical protein n=1 Tax=unclassified Ruminococcus TaxID=2608920 RepID=UPI000881ED5C|nr:MULTISPECIES: hypothetical protein [unclassified Ruminococcus]SDA15272.1 hypothetical protein SAMN02910446_00896 [Ruminococcus sp. YE78]SFW22270.1 hypothetical protein SAMN02910447_00897 [Ruminococcus sp. YE71]
MAKLRMLFLILAILLIVFGVCCFIGSNYIAGVQDRVEDSWAATIDMGYTTMSREEFLDYADENVPKLKNAGIVSECAAAGCIVLFAIGEAKLKKSNKAE